MMKNIACQLEHSVEADVVRLLAACGERQRFLDGSPCGGASVTFGPAGLSSWRCRSTERCCRLGGRLTPCRTGEHKLGNALSCRATTLPHMGLKCATVSDRRLS